LTVTLAIGERFFLLDPIFKDVTLKLFFIMTIEIKLRKGEPMDRAIRRLKKRLDREGVIRDVRAKRYFEKPSDKKRKARKVAAFTQMLRTRYEKM
tara:strand:+ start:229 stop:513 length:285 start_codon:yes stop_codon:yes gene_type:complete